jgi:hypothetical protein
MKPISIYEALGIVEMASVEEARFALRRLLRLIYKKTRDNLGTTEESLRFYNQASQILNDDSRRDLYDQEWALTKGTSDERIAAVVDAAAKTPRKVVPAEQEKRDAENDAEIAPTQQMKQHKPLELLSTNFRNFLHASTTVAPTMKMVFQTPAVTVPADNGAMGTPEERTQPETLKDTVERAKLPPKPTTQQYHPALTDTVVFARTALTQCIGAALILIVLLALAWVCWGYVSPDFRIGETWIWLPLAVLAVLIATVGFQRPAHKIFDRFHLMTSPNEDAIRGWRRRSAVFLGSNHLTEDPSWVFQLRLAELERARIDRTSLIAPWRRGAARFFDYALWGWFLMFPFYELARQGFISGFALQAIANPIVAPILITLTWVPIEALLTAAVGTTPGKWLFGLYVQFQVSSPYSSRTSEACWRYAISRAFRVWMEGIGFGFAPFTAFAAARSLSTLLHYEETEWDTQNDCVLTNVPMKNGVIGATIAGLVLLTFLFVIAWQSNVFLVFNHQRSDMSAAAFASLQKTLAVEDEKTAVKWSNFRQAILNVSEESKTLMRRGQWREAYASCRHWAQLEITNPAPLRCQGIALQKMGRHLEAIEAFRKAKMFAPQDKSLDAAIQTSQEEVFHQMNQ